MKRTLSKESRLQRAQELSRQIASLTHELEAILLEESTPAHQPQSEDIAIGDRVRILNSTLQGSTAEVIGLTPKRVILKLKSGAIVYRARHNLSRI